MTSLISSESLIFKIDLTNELSEMMKSFNEKYIKKRDLYENVNVNGRIQPDTNILVAQSLEKSHHITLHMNVPMDKLSDIEKLCHSYKSKLKLKLSNAIVLEQRNVPRGKETVSYDILMIKIKDVDDDNIVEIKESIIIGENSNLKLEELQKDIVRISEVPALHNNFMAHVTIGYFLPGAGQKYVDLANDYIKNINILANYIVRDFIIWSKYRQSQNTRIPFSSAN